MLIGNLIDQEQSRPKQETTQETIDTVCDDEARGRPKNDQNFKKGQNSIWGKTQTSLNMPVGNFSKMSGFYPTRKFGQFWAPLLGHNFHLPKLQTSHHQHVCCLSPSQCLPLLISVHLDFLLCFLCFLDLCVLNALCNLKESSDHCMRQPCQTEHNVSICLDILNNLFLD